MKIGLLASGGVDSSVAMLKLSQQYASDELTVYYLKIWLEDEFKSRASCPWQEDIEYIKETCNLLNLNLQIISLQQEYYEYIVHYVLEELRAGRTPSPDVLCNRHIKFGAFRSKIQESLDFIASGHYAQIRGNSIENCQLLCSPDKVKDQTYFLAQMQTEQLCTSLFPIGAMTKAEVREAAIKAKLPAAKRPDSQGICFLGKISYKDFVEHYLGTKTGKIVDYDTGDVLAEHRGYWFYTIGQRQGIGLGNGPWYVAAKDIESNTIFVSRNVMPQAMFSVEQLNWIGNGNRPSDGTCQVKIRHAPERVDAMMTFCGERVKVELSNSDQGIAAGQFAVFYRDEVCLGSGRIVFRGTDCQQVDMRK